MSIMDNIQAYNEEYQNMLGGSKVTFEILNSSIKEAIAVSQYSVHEAISECFLTSVAVYSSIPIPVDKVMKEPCRLTVEGIGGTRYFHGIIGQITMNGRDDEFYMYQTMISPRLSFLRYNHDCRHFVNMTIIEIVRTVLNESGLFENKDFEFKNIDKKKYPKIEYCAQYREDKLNFINRILEKEGIFYYFVHSKENHKVIFADKNSAFDLIQGPRFLTFNSGSGMVTREESVTSITASQNVFSGNVVQKSFNFELYRTNLEKKENVKDNAEFEYYDYSCDYKGDDDGKRLTTIRLEERQMMQFIASGTSNCSRFAAGCTFELMDHTEPVMNKSHILTSVSHHGVQHGKNAYSYGNSFTVIPESIPFRPTRRAIKQLIIGLQSATVVGPENQEIHTDKYGRVKVKFHWDRRKDDDESTSCYLRIVNPWTGELRGAVFTPRKGDEVIVAYMEGDPDQPVIIGSPFNSKNRPFFDLQNRNTISVIKTKSTPNSEGFNELRFDDKAGSEEIYIHAEKDWNADILNDNSITIGNNKTESIGTEHKMSVGTNQIFDVGDKLEITCGESKLTMSKDGTVTITGAKFNFAASGLVQINGMDVKVNKS